MQTSSQSKPQLRVLHALFSPRMAGSERYCVDLANQQAEQGYEVHVAGLPGSPMQRALNRAVTFHGMRWPLLRGMRLRRLMEQVSADVCHAHLSPACKALANAPEQIATVATLHVGYKRHQHGHLGGVVCVNHAQLGRLGDFDGHKRVIPNWLPSTATPLPGSRQQRRAELGIDDESTLLVGAVGRLHASKGMDVLIRAFQAFAPSHAALVIVGEGPQRAALEQLINGDRRIRLLGFRDDVSALLGAFDLFVSPSLEESFGLAIPEAMAAGLPMVSTATEGPCEILRNSPVELVTPGSSHELGIALARALARLDTGAARRESYDLRPYAPAGAVANIAELYTQLVHETGRRRALPPAGLPELHVAGGPRV